MHYIIGLGNPGEQYEHTRHNVGWMVLDALVEAHHLPAPVASSKYAGDLSEGVVSGTEVKLLYPKTFMNKSGSAARKLVPKGEEGQVIVVYDDVDLPLGEIKVSISRGAGGHNGVASVIDALGTKDFVRIRVGVASKSLFGFGPPTRPKGERLSQHVLGMFKPREHEALAVALTKATDAIIVVLTKGIEMAMNTYNETVKR